MKEAAARIKINRMLEKAGCGFFADANGPANIQLEPSVTMSNLNEKRSPLIVLGAKSKDLAAEANVPYRTK